MNTEHPDSDQPGSATPGAPSRDSSPTPQPGQADRGLFTSDKSPMTRAMPAVSHPDKADPGDDIPTYKAPQQPRPMFATAPPENIPAPQPPAAPRETETETTVFAAQPQAPAPSRSGYVPPQPQAAEQPTTMIPRVDVAGPGDYAPPVGSAPVQPAPMPAAPTGIPVQQTAPVVTPTDEGKRGTIDFGLFMLRIFFGALLVFNAASVLFNLDGTGGLQAMEKSFGHYHYPELLAIGVTGVELAAGVFIVLGLLTPFAAAFSVLATTFLALHAIFVSHHSANPVFWEDSVWLALILVVIGVAMQFTGPGKISCDFARSWAKRPLVSSWVFFVLGVAAAVALWIFGAGVNPFAAV